MKLTLFLSFLQFYFVNYSMSQEINSTVFENQLLESRTRIWSKENLQQRSDVEKVPGSKIDAAHGDQYIIKRILRPVNPENVHRRNHRKSSSYVDQSIFPSALMKIQSVFEPTNYIGIQGENELAGPEGKIAEALVKSINGSLVINALESKGLKLNLVPISSYGSWSLVYHPYRKLPLVPVIHSGSTIQAQVTFCLLTMLTIMIIMLMHVMRNLIRINDFKTKDALEFLKCIVMPKGYMGVVESILYLCLAFMFFMNLGIILEIIFREKYGKNNFEKIRNIEDIDKLNLKPIFSTKQCLRELVINKSKNVYCIVGEDFGKEVIRRYGNDGRNDMLQLIDSFYFKFEWRGLQLDSDRYLDKFNDMQLKLVESGLLEKWYKDEMIMSLGDEEKEMKKLRFTWSSRARDESDRLKKFVYLLMLMVFNGGIMAFLMFIAEFFMLRNSF